MEQTDVYNECVTGKSDWICKSCHNSMMRNKMLIQAQGKYMELCPRFSELDKLSPIAIVGTLSPLQVGRGLSLQPNFQKGGT